jgi:hypothetical protein
MFEFDTEQESVIWQLAAGLQNFGVVALLSAAAMFARLLFGVIVMTTGGWVTMGVLTLLVASLQIVIAVLMLGAGRVLMAIPRTEGDDLPHLMRGLRRLTLLYTLQAIAMLAVMAIAAAIAVAVYA